MCRIQDVGEMATKTARNHPIVDNSGPTVSHWTGRNFPRSTILDVLLVVRRGGPCSVHPGFPGSTAAHDSGLVGPIQYALSRWTTKNLILVQFCIELGKQYENLN